MANNFLIVGLSGATNSGKTTTVEKLLQYFPKSSTMCQDNYFLAPGDSRLEFIPEINHANWEVLSAMDMDSMMKHVKTWISAQQAKGDNSTNLLFIEGILIFNHRPLAELFNKKYFLTLDETTCKVRRDGRVYDPPDPPGYFEKVVWPMYGRNLDELKDQTDICYMDGTQSQEATVNRIKEDILSSIRNQQNVPRPS